MDDSGRRQGSFTATVGLSSIDMRSASDSVLDKSSGQWYCAVNGSAGDSTITHASGAAKPLDTRLHWTVPSTDVGSLTWMGLVQYSNVIFYVQVLTPWTMCAASSLDSSSCPPFDPSTLPTGPLPTPARSPTVPTDVLPISSATCGSFTPVRLSAVPAGFCVSAFAVNLSRPRGLFALGGDVLVVETGGGSDGGVSGVSLLRDVDGDGLIDRGSEYFRMFSQVDLLHGLYVHSHHLYTSSASTVWRVLLQPTDVTQPVNTTLQTVVVRGIPATHHTTRTLLVDRSNWLYVSVGSASNIDVDDSRARVVRYRVGDDEVPVGGWQWNEYESGRVEVFARGPRNEVGLMLGARGVMWDVMNGGDELSRSDLGGYSIHNTNPAERLDKLSDEKMIGWYGYLQYWAVGSLPPLPVGTMMAWGSSSVDYYATAITPMHGARRTRCHRTTLCQHTLLRSACTTTRPTTAAFPARYSNVFYIAPHSSWDATPLIGYKVTGIRTTVDSSSGGIVVRQNALPFDLRGG